MRFRALTHAAQALLRLLYDDEGVFYRRYHAVVTGDAGARVSRWGAVPRDAPPVPGLPPPAPGDLTRSVSFVKRMELPTAITRLLGAPALLRRAVRCSQAAASPAEPLRFLADPRCGARR